MPITAAQHYSIHYTRASWLHAAYALEWASALAIARSLVDATATPKATTTASSIEFLITLASMLIHHLTCKRLVFTVYSTARQVRDCVEWIYSEPMLIYYIQLFRDAYWPDGQLAAASELPTELQRLQLRRQAKLALLHNIPGLSCAVYHKECVLLQMAGACV